jgi:hypothetical protein
VDKNGEEENTRGWITTFAPGSARFVTTVVKVHGRMKASVIRQSGTPVLRITVDYIFVYVVEPPGDPAGWMRDRAAADRDRGFRAVRRGGRLLRAVVQRQRHDRGRAMRHS